MQKLIVAVAIALEVSFAGCAEPVSEVGSRLFEASKQFMGIPYDPKGPLGEGPNGEFDRNPLISFAGLDCTTFVEETMAYAFGSGTVSVADVLRNIRYKNGAIGYETRNHFPELDWIPNNTKAGFIRDITEQVAGDKTGVVKKLFSKRKWYQNKTEENLKGFENIPAGERAKLLAKFRAAGEKYPDEEAAVKFVPLDNLMELLPKIPSGTMGFVVREQKDDKPTLITHQFFIFDGPKGKFIRHAAYGKAVMDVPVAEYVKTMKASTTWRILGLHLEEVLPQ